MSVSTAAQNGQVVVRMNWQAERELLWETARDMAREGLVTSYSGNASMLLPEKQGQKLVLITPSRRAYEDLTTEDLAVIDLEGEPVEETMMPSSESHLHLAIYKSRPDVGAILHTHSIYASVAAVAGLSIPPIIDEMVIALGGEVSVADYGFPGTEELSSRTVEALGDRNAVLLRNHGMVGVGGDVKEALEVCKLAERAAQVYVLASALGKVNALPQEIVEVERSLYLMSRRVRSRGNSDADSP